MPGVSGAPIVAAVRFNDDDDYTLTAAVSTVRFVV
jgi:hypothetical protein